MSTARKLTTQDLLCGTKNRLYSTALVEVERFTSSIRVNTKRPRSKIGLLKKLSVEEMERLIFENTMITEDDLTELALDRARRIRDLLLDTGQVEPERLFLAAPEGTSGSFVELRPK